MKLAYLSLIAIVLWSCQSNNYKTIRVGILDGPSAVSFAPMMADKQKINGFDIQFIIKDEPIQIQAMMMQNELDLAILPTVMAANLYNKGIEYQMVACPVWGTLYIVGNEQKYTQLRNLEGKDIYTFGQGATADVLLRRFLQQSGLKNTQIKYDYPSNNELVQALLNEKIHFAVVSEPMVSTLMNLNSNIKIISPVLCEDTINGINKNIFAQTALLTQNLFSYKYSELLEEFLNTYEKSCKSMNSPSDKSLEWLVDAGYYPSANIATESLHTCNISYVPAASMKNELNRYLQIFYNFDAKSIGGKLPDEDFILK